MNSLNRLFIIGNITRDAELKNVNVNGVETPRCSFSVAVNETRSNGEPVTTYFDVTLWREYAVKMAKWLVKGRQVHVEGAVRLHQYIDAMKKVNARMQLHSPTVTLLGKKPETELPENIEDPFDEDEELPFG